MKPQPSRSHDGSNRAAVVFRQNGGMMRMADAVRAGINRKTLYAMRDSGELEQLARGLYRLADLQPLGAPDLVTVAAKVPQAVIYLVSALAFHELTTQIPHEIWIAVPRNSEPPKLPYPPLRVSRLGDAAYRAGIEQRSLDDETIRVYSREKTLVDCFCRRSDVGMDVALEAVKTYKSQGKTKVDLIMEYAKLLRVSKTIQPYLEALL